MKKIEQIVLLTLLMEIFPTGKLGNLESANVQQDSFSYRSKLEELTKQKPFLELTKINPDFSLFAGCKKNNKTPAYVTPSQAAVDSVINADLETYHRTGKGLYIGRPINHPRGIQPEEIKEKHISVDCYDALGIVLGAEMPQKIKTILANSKDRDGNFSTPFMIRYLIEREGWEAYGYYDEKNTAYKKLKGKIIRENDLAIETDKSGEVVYRSGGVKFFLKEFFTKSQADSLLKKLTLERGYAVGFQRDGTHCYALVQKGMFEIHLNSFPLGYELKENVRLRPLDLHEGKYVANSSVAVFAFPPRRDFAGIGFNRK